MTINNRKIGISFILGIVLLICPLVTLAEGIESTGSVGVMGQGITPPTDPEEPGKQVDPGPGPKTSGSLRIDFVSALTFGKQEITQTNRVYPSHAQLFHDETTARGYYIQITDERQRADGWTLQVKQETQFTNSVIQKAEEKELRGAVLSFDKGHADSLGASVMKAPEVTRDTIALHAIGESYEVAKAEPDTGMGIWTIEFGQSGKEDTNILSTLSPLLDKEGQPVMDETFNKNSYTNSAVTLTVPDSVPIYPVQYETEITWILAKLP